MLRFVLQHHPTGRFARSGNAILTYENWREAARIAEQMTLADAPWDPDGYWYFRETTSAERRALAISNYRWSEEVR